MKAKIVQRLVGSLKPSEKPYEVVDTEVPGFILRVQPSGVMTYYATYRLASGKRNRLKLGSARVLTPAQARDRAKEKLAVAASGDDPAESRRIARSHTLSQYLDEVYGPWVVANRKTGEHLLRYIKINFQGFLDKRLSEIKQFDIEKWRVARKRQGKKDATINRYLSALRAALNMAIANELLEKNPFERVKLAREDVSSKPRYLSEEEETSFFEALEAREESIREGRENGNRWRNERGYEEYPDLGKVSYVDHLKPMVLIALNTGMRRGELFSLEWEDVDFKQKFITIQGSTAKSGKTRHIPLNSIAHEVLTLWREQTSKSGLVFKNRGGGRFNNVKTSWTSLVEAAGIKKFRWHDMRHHFASKLVMAGVDLNTVRELLGHGDIKMTLRYAHLAPHVKAAAVEKLVIGGVKGEETGVEHG